MTTVAVAVGAAAASMLAVGLVSLLLRRTGRLADERVSRAVDELDERMEAMLRELAGALERAQEEGRRNRFLAELAGSIDLDEVLTRALETAAELPGVDACVLSLAEVDGKPLVATLGLSSEEAARQAVAGPPDGRPARSITIRYEYPAGLAGADAVRAGLAVPIENEGARMGYLTVYTRSEAHAFGDDAVRELEELAKRAGPAIENARRFQEAKQLADLDALTGLHNRRYFHETLQREVARAHRYGRELALIVFDLDDFKAINDRIGHLAGDAVLAEAADRVRDVVRSADVACRVGGDEFAVILSESGVADADALYRRLLHAVSSRPVGLAGHLLLSAGVTELRPEDDATSLFERADTALYRAKEAGKARVSAEPGNA